MIRAVGIRTLGIAVAVVLATTAAGCTWRAEPPAKLKESVQVIVRSADLRLPRAAVLVEHQVADALVRDLGWRVSPTGSARLELALQVESIRRTASDDRSIPLRWEVRLHGTAMLTSAHGTPPTYRFTGNGSYGGLSDEDTALRAAADDAAANLVAWLEGLTLK